ncbi:MAG: DJ-1/PfpI family protein, partial [Burkholderiales bacterium]|nr:DJ-1/PfpI family protein [Burkholderiales bacterium]
MSRVLLALIHGFEEVEALTAVDILRRGGVDVITTSLGDSPLVTGRHEVPVLADALFEGDFPTDFDMIVIPGGTIAYVDHPGFMSYVRQFAAKKKPIAAICAAPAVLGRLGLLKGKTCVCYPGMEHEMVGANIS